MNTSNHPLSKKRKFIKNGVFFAEINEFLRRMLAEDGYAGVEIKPRPECTQIVIKCTKTPEVVKRIPYIQKLLQLRHQKQKEDEDSGDKKKQEPIKVFAEKVQPRGLSARAQAQSICYKLKGGLAVRRACYGGLKFIMDNGGAKGVQIIISGKLRGARAKAMKFKEGYMITSGEAKKQYITEAVEHVLLRQGTIGVRVTIMLPHDETGRSGVKDPLPDVVIVRNPKTYDNDDDGLMPDNGDMGYADQAAAQQQPPQQQQYDSGYGAPPQQYQETPGYGAPQQYQQPPPQQYQTPGGYGNPATAI